MQGNVLKLINLDGLIILEKLKERKQLTNGDTLDLIKLPAERLPWRYQITRTVPDGAAYEKPGRPCTIDFINYKTLEEARADFDAES